jgi:Kef-type K+ transport system membrane component KefB
MLPAHIAVAIATVASLFVRVAQRSHRWGKAAGAPQLIVLALSVWEVGGLIVLYTAPALAAAGSAEPNFAALAALRTAVLSAAAATLAVSSRHPRWPEARWLAYPLLILVGIKLFAEDFPNGNAASLFVALAFVGTALIITAKLVPHSEDIEEAEEAG